MLKQKLNLKLQQKLSPQQIQVIKLLELPVMVLEQRIKKEIEENPALEETDSERDNIQEDQEVESVDETDSNADDEFSIDDYINEEEYNSYNSLTKGARTEDDNKEIPFSVGNTFHEHLNDQLGMRNFNDEDRALAEYLIGNIDEDGYLRREIESIVDDLAFSLGITVEEEVLERILLELQQLDPPGIGARDLQECLLLQIRRKDRTVATVTAEKILADTFNEFTKKHYEKIQQKLEIEEEDLKDAIEEIVKLNPKPGSSYSDPHNKTAHQTISPDFILEHKDSDFEISLSSQNVPELRVNKNYSNMLHAYKESKKKTKQLKDTVQFVKQKLDSAKWFIDAIRQRHATLLGTMEAIAGFQRDFFMTGDETRLRPMILKDIAEITGLDVSTISRVANSKYILTPFGTYSLKYFFSESMQTESGEEVSTREIKKILKDCIDAEDKRKPYTDEALSKILKEKGYKIARRTVAKYREQLDIPVGRLRKEI